MLLPIGAASLWDIEAGERESDVELIGCLISGSLSTEVLNMNSWKGKPILELEASAKEDCKYCLLNRLARVLPRGANGKAPNRYGICIFQLGGDEPPSVLRIVTLGNEALVSTKEEPSYIGLWNFTLDVDLLWVTKDDRTAECNVLMSGEDQVDPEKYAKVIDGNVRIFGLDQFGQIMQPGRIKVFCPIFEATVHYAPEDSNRRLQGTSVAARCDADVDGTAVGEFHAEYGLEAARGGEGACVPDGFKVYLALMTKTYNSYVYIVLIRINLWPRNEQELVELGSYSSDLSRILLGVAN
ncbi:hypothetical protein F4814DRAFT_453738 [Daldinia grandis]|nr:hypothetical protein F4814DRAFT_453738 [Daldinia grandis]